MLDTLKNSRFITMICDQLNRLPPTLVGLLTILAYILGAIGISALALVVFALFAFSLMLLATFCLSLPYGIGMGILCLIMHIGLWNIDASKNSKNAFDADITKRSVKLWCLAGVLGYIAFALFPMGRQLLVETQWFGTGPNVVMKAILGLQVFGTGWLMLSLTQIPKVIPLISEAWINVKAQLASTGLNSLKKCAELKSSVVE